MYKRFALTALALTFGMMASCAQENLGFQWWWEQDQGIADADDGSTGANTGADIAEAESLTGPSEVDANRSAPPKEDPADAVRNWVAQLDGASTPEARQESPAAARRSTSKPVVSQQPVARQPAYYGSTAQDSGAIANQALEVDPSARRQPGRSSAPQLLGVHVQGGDTLDVDNGTVTTFASNRAMNASGATDATNLRRLIERAEARLAEDPANTARQWQLSLLQLAAGQDAEAALVSTELPSNTADMIRLASQSISACGQMLNSPHGGGTAAVTAVDRLRAELAENAELSIPVVALCTRVMNYGVYDALPDEGLIPNQANTVIVYWEVANFASRQDDRGVWHTELSSNIEVFSEDGRSLWRQDIGEIKDLCRARRRDFFMAKLVVFPPDLGPGTYLLKVTTTDLNASKTNEATLRFQIGDIRPGDVLGAGRG